MVNSFQARRWGMAQRGLLALIAALAFGLTACSAPGGAIVNPTDTVRTAIAIGQTQTYRTHLPGDGCDINGGLWESARNTSIACGPNATHVQEGKDDLVGVLFFDWKDGYTFPANYSAAVTISALQSDTCAGINTRTREKDRGSYGFYICGDGAQIVIRYNATTGKPTTIGGTDQPHTPPSSTFSITASSIGDQQCMQVEGQQKFCVADATYTVTDTIGLAVFTENAGGSASFSDFVFTPLP